MLIQVDGFKYHIRIRWVCDIISIHILSLFHYFSIPTSASMPTIDDLCFAVFGGQVDRVRAIVQSGVDVNARNSKGMTPLWCAVYMERHDVIDYLVQEAGCLCVEGLCAAVGYHRIGYRASGSRVDLQVVKTLVEAGVDVHGRSSITGDTPLWAAVHYERWSWPATC